MAQAVFRRSERDLRGEAPGLEFRCPGCGARVEFEPEDAEVELGEVNRR